MKNISIAYIGGGSRGWAPVLMNDLVREPDFYGTVNLFDTDHEAAADNAAIGNMYNSVENAVSSWDYRVMNTLEEALDSVDFVIISILPGPLDLMEKDVHLPEEYGIYQSVGDTVGPGGIMRSVRAIPMYQDIAEAIKKICPYAYVITYTNPMTVLTRTLYSVFPEIKAFGCCHEVFGTQRLLAEVVEHEGLAEKTDRHDIDVNVLGINHFTWLDRAKYKGFDLFPYYRQFVNKYHSTGYVKEGNWDDTPFTSASMVKMDLFQRYGLIAAAGDRHLAEFCPGWYLKNPKTAKSYKYSLTPVSYRKNDYKERRAKVERILSGEETIELRETGEEGVRMVRALCGIEDFITNVNMPNTGQHEGLPKGAVVETNAVFSGDGIRPVDAGRLPKDIENLVQRHVYNQESLVKSCLEQDREGIFRVFVNDPLVHLSIKDAKEMFDRMFSENESFFQGEY